MNVIGGLHRDGRHGQDGGRVRFDDQSSAVTLQRPER